MNLSMVAAPNRVEKVQIGYAKQAKKMDMRRLKTVEWKILHSVRSGEADKENEDGNGLPNGSVGGQSFEYGSAK